MTDHTYYPPAGRLGVFIDEAQRAAGVSDHDLARELGFSRPSIVMLVKASKMKLPVSKVIALAGALRIQPGELLRELLADYFGTELQQEVEKVTGLRGLTDGERRVLEAFRALCKDQDDMEPKIVDGRNVVLLVVTT